ncbi:glycoside hydrolase family 98 domain-containing protein [Robinsoniella peoriensis]|uniref:glycoside hydrolase family 98 domain-containing protein n=1 Tax=Robinsoniella peoriensis TaxID=180332 RepID=UPI00363C20A3
MKFRAKKLVALLTASCMCLASPLSAAAESGTGTRLVKGQTGYLTEEQAIRNQEQTTEEREQKLTGEETAEVLMEGTKDSGIVQTEEVQTKEMQTEDAQTEEVQTEEMQTEDAQTKEVQTEEMQTEDAQTEEVQTKEEPAEETHMKEIQTQGTKKASDRNGKVRVTEILEDAQDPANRIVYLSDLQWKSENHTVDSELPTRKDKSFGGGKITLKVDGTVTEFDKGIGTQTDSTIVYDLEGKGYTKFETYVGVDYSQKENIPGEVCDVEFRVKIDDKIVSETGVLDPLSNAVKISVNIPDTAKTLTLYADKVTETWSDHANWADAKFYQTLPEPENVAFKKTVVARKSSDNSEAPVNPDSAVNSSKAVDGVIDSSSYFDFGDQANSGAVRESLYVEVDLKGSYLLSDIQLWRYWKDGRTYAATAIVVSEDESFENAAVIFNSDTTGEIHHLGAGSDMLYAETESGKTFPVPENTKARYIRVYTYGVNGTSGVTNHIVELNVNAYVFGDEIVPEKPDDSKIFPNAVNPLKLQGPGTNDQVTHPDVTVFDEPWNGYKYWMAYTPNKPGSSYFENPCIAASNDGVNWEFPAQNPVQPRYDSEIENQNEHNCDTDIVYDPVNDRLIMYWEWAQDEAVNGKTHRSEIRYRVSYDGINWGVEDETDVLMTGPTDHGCAIATEGERYSDLSPTVVYDKTEKIYKMWANDAGDVGYENKQNNKVWYRTSQDGISNWSDKTYVENFLGVNEDGLQMYPWHQDIQWVEEFQEYWALQQAFPAGSGPDNSSLRFSKSKDGIHWEPVSEKALITVGAPGTWDAGQIYRSTFWYEPGGAKGNGTFHIWYAALAEGQSHWDIGYTSANYADAMYKLTGSRPEVEKRIEVNNENPLLIMPLYGKSYSESGSTLDWGDDLVSRWKQVPEDLKENAVIEIHLGGKIGLNESDSHTAKAFYEQQLAIAQENNIPVMMVVATAGQQNYWTGTANLDAEWIDRMFKQHSVLKGIMSTENYWTDYNKVATMGADYLRVAAENGGYFVWSEHQEGVIENVIANEKFNEALKLYGNNFIFTWKNTPAGTNSNAGTASYMQGLWLTGICAQWGGLADTWKWYEKGFGKLFDGQYSYNPGGEEARPVATEPEALLGIEMMSIYTNGGCVYNFEHPAYVYGSYNQNSPCFENVIAEFMRYAIKNPAPGKEEVLADTKAVFYGKLSSLKSAGNLLQKGLNWEDATLPTQTTGRYGLIPAVPEAVDEKTVKAVFGDIEILNQSSAQLANKDAKKAYFEEKYPEQYTGTAFGQLLNDTWYLYNSNVNVDGVQNAKLPLEGNKSVDITMTPHTYVILDDQDGELQIKLNNYRVDKDSIWEGYGTTVTDRWDTDHNTKLQDWIRDEYIPNPDDDTFRDTTFELVGLESEPEVNVTNGLKDQYQEPVVEYDAAAGTAMITVSGNGWVDLTIDTNTAEVPQVDKAKLNSKIAEAKGIRQGNYTDESYKALQEEIGKSQAVWNKTDATQEEVNAQLSRLESAIARLKEKPAVVSKTALNAKIAEAKGIRQGNYTDESYKALQNAIVKAQELSNKTDATQQQVNDLVSALTNAIKNLKIDADKLAAESAKKVAAVKVAVKAVSYKSKEIKLSWKTVADADGYVIRVKTGKKWSTEKTIKNNRIITYTYKKGTPGKKYVFEVKAFKKVNGKTTYSKYKTATKKVVPQTVTAKAKASKNNVVVKWNKVSGASGYVVMKKKGKTWVKAAQVNAKKLYFTDKKVKKGKVYSYKVKAYKVYKGKKVYGSYSKSVNVKTKS